MPDAGILVNSDKQNLIWQRKKENWLKLKLRKPATV